MEDELTCSGKPVGNGVDKVRNKKKRKRKAVCLAPPRAKPKLNEASITSKRTSTKNSSGGSDIVNLRPTLFKSTAESQKIVSTYHVLMKHREQILAKTIGLSESEKSEKIQAIDLKIKNMGGIERYQQASMYGASTHENAGFNASLWVTTELRRQKIMSGTSNLKILDVGAIDDQYLSYKDFLEVTSIDINPQSKSVKKYDFFDFAVDYIMGEKDMGLGGQNAPYDVIVLSLVLNFVGCPRRRGDMLALCAHPKILKEQGLVFVVIPAACVENSRYMELSTLIDLMDSLHFSLVSTKTTKALLLCVFRLRNAKQWWSSQAATPPAAVRGDNASFFDYGAKGFPRRKVRGGKQRNNFSIILRPTTTS